MERAKTDKRLEAARNMPPLSRKQDTETYQFEHDKVAKWIAGNKSLMNYFIDFLAHNSYIAYNTETHKWEGNSNAK